MATISRIYQKTQNLEQVLHLTNFFAITPHYDFYNRNFKSPTKSKLRSVFMATLIFSGWVFSIFYRYHHVYQQNSIPPIVSATDCVQYFCTFCFSLISFLWIPFGVPNAFLDFFLKMSHVDEMLKIFKAKSKTLDIVVLHCILLFLFLTDMVIWSLKVDTLIYLKSFLCEYFQHYLKFITIYVIVNFVDAIKFRFEELHRPLEMIRASFITRTGFKTGASFKTTIDLKRKTTASQKEEEIFEKTLKRSIQVYTLLNELIQTFNQVFGPQLLFLVLDNFFTVLCTLNLASSKITSDGKLEWDSCCLFVMWTSISLVSIKY